MHKTCLQVSPTIKIMLWLISLVIFRIRYHFDRREMLKAVSISSKISPSKLPKVIAVLK